MSSYHNSFSYLGKNSTNDFNWIISHFDSDSGEAETGLSTESIYTASADGTSRKLYGTKYSGPEPVRITVIKQNGGDWTIGDNRQALKWLTGAKSDSWLDLYIGDEVKYRMLGHVQNVLQYKMDARIIGLVIVFESASPFAFSNLQTVTHSISGSKIFSIDNPSDDNYTFVKMKTTYKNTSGNAVTIKNTTTDEETQINNLAINETVTLNNNQSIVSDKPNRVFGNDFNFRFPRLGPGLNEFVITGTGNLTFEYLYFIKIGDMATELNAVSDPICDDFGNIQIDTLDWSRISNTPNTLSGYGITDAYPTSAVYNKNEINIQMQNIIDEVDSTTSLISTLSSGLENDYYDKVDIENNYYTKSEIDDIVYTEEEINATINELDFNVRSNASLISNVSSDLENNYYDKTDIESNYYNKSEIDDIVYVEEEVNNKINKLDFNIKSNASLISNISSELYKHYYNKNEIDDIISGISYTPPIEGEDIPSSIMWGQITNKPTTLAGYRVEQEVQQMIDTSLSFVQVSIDEDELNAMLTEVLI